MKENIWYVMKDGRTLSDYVNESQARKHADKIGGEVCGDHIENIEVVKSEAMRLRAKYIDKMLHCGMGTPHRTFISMRAKIEALNTIIDLINHLKDDQTHD